MKLSPELISIGCLLGLTEESREVIKNYALFKLYPVFSESFASNFMNLYCRFRRLIPSYKDGYDEVQMIAFILLLFLAIKTYKINPSMLFNFDETAICQSIPAIRQYLMDINGVSRAYARKATGLMKRITACCAISRAGIKSPAVYIYNSLAKNVRSYFFKLKSTNCIENPLVKQVQGVDFEKHQVDVGIKSSVKADISTDSRIFPGKFLCIQYLRLDLPSIG